MVKTIDGIDFQKNEASNLRLQNLAADISSPVDGLIYYKNASGIGIRAYINGTWQTLATMADVTAGGISSNLIDVKGDILVGTADNTIARKAAGSNNFALRANSAQGDGLEWRADLASDIAVSATDRLIGRDTAAAGAGEEITVGGGIEFTGSGGIQRSVISGDIDIAAGSGTAAIASGVIVNADVNASAGIVVTKLASSATDRLFGRDTASAGAGEEITVGGGLEFTGSGGIQRSALTGDVTSVAGSGTTAIAAGVIVDADVNASAGIALSKLATQAANTIVGNNTGGAAVPIALTAAQTKTLLAIVPGDITGFDTQVRTNRLDQMAAPTASVALGAQKITGLADGTATTDAATFGQLNAILEGKEWKSETVETATTGVLPNTPTYSSGAGTLTAGSNTTLAAQDGVTLALNDSILVKDQASTFQDGIYTLTATGSGAAPWVLTRRADSSTAAELTKGATVFVASTSQTNSGRTYTQTNVLANLTADAQAWTLTGDATVVYTADGTTITLTGTQFAVTTGGISNTHINASAAIARSKLDFGSGLVNADLAAAAAIAYSKLNLTGAILNADLAGSIAYGKLVLTNSVVNADIAAAAAIAYSKLALTGSIVNADINASAAIAYSKINLASSLLAADVNGTGVASGSGTVRIARSYAQAITGGATSEVITHGLGTRNVVVSLVNPSTPWDHVIFTPESTSTTTVTIRSSVNLPAGYLITIVG